MATVVLQYAGAAVGTLIGGPLGGIVGRAAGAIAGNLVDQKLFGSKARHTDGPRLNELRIMASDEGAPIPRLWGRMRLAGQVIWATNFEEAAKTDTQKSSAKGSGPKPKTTTYSYYANFAVGLCEGPIRCIGRVWADGKEIDLAAFTYRLYTGSETQAPDSLIIAKEGQCNAPAYRGHAYIVFERMPLEAFGNRLPQLSFEVIGQGTGADRFIRSVNVIPGSTEFGYDPRIIVQKPGGGKTISENAHASAARSDWTVSLDALQASCPNVSSVSLVIAWFGNDLRCGMCQLRPGVETRNKTTKSVSWSVAGLNRSSAYLVSLSQGKPAYGGTPSDEGVIRAILDLKTRGVKPVIYPFILMDIPAGNSFADPYGAAAQPSYPWRGRMTCHPAAGMAGTADKTVAAAQQLSNFIGTAQAAHFTLSGSKVIYSGPPEWSYRRMILHYAKLCQAAGGVDTFLIGSELRGLTTVRSSALAFPFVAALVQLAQDVKAMLPTAKISYAADWSEYFGHQPADGSKDVFYHLDPLWSSPALDVIGIDNYMPLSDWRDQSTHADALAGWTSIYDLNYLKSGIAGGEGYDWYYASQADRDGQIRTPILDAAYNKPWVFRYKDLKNWWGKRHYDRPGGIENAQPTGFVPESKPIWFTEAGCAAIDKGTNQPNVFVDPKSAESMLPYYSSGQRDDAMQARYIMALGDYWSQIGTNNPLSSVYAGPMVDATRISFWCWDARPYPQFPNRSDIWADAANYPRGHWLNGRISGISIGELLQSVCAEYKFLDTELDGFTEMIDGFVIDRPMTARAALEGLMQAFAIDALESNGKLRFTTRSASKSVVLRADDCVEIRPEDALFKVTRAQEADLPAVLKLIFADSSNDYRSAVGAARSATGRSARETVVNLPCSTTQAVAKRLAEVMLQESWASRDSLHVSLPPSYLRLDVGDVINFANRRFRVDHITDSTYRRISASTFEAAVYDSFSGPDRNTPMVLPSVFGEPNVVLMDLALSNNSAAALPWLAANADPWPGALALLKQVGTSSFTFNRLIETQATLGTTLTSFATGPRFLFDRATMVDVQLSFGALSSVSELEVLNSANVAAIGTAATGYEIIQFAKADLIAPMTWRLSVLLRAQGGSDVERLASRPAGSDFVLLNGAVVQPDVSLAEALSASNWRLGPSQLDQGHPAYTDFSFQGFGRGLRPLSPARLQARRSGADVVFSWVRRARSDGDSWDLREIPLDEPVEAYRLTIWSGGLVKRTVDIATPTYRYPAADIVTDFGAAPASFDVSVAQISALTGAGAPTRSLLYA